MTWRIGIIPQERQRELLLGLLAIAAFRFWVMPLNSSLWLDETGTYWTVKDGLARALERSFGAQVSSPPLHSAIELAFLKLPLRPEIALRIPSLCATLVSMLLLYRLGKRLLDRESALIAVCIFTSASQVIFAGADARAYALLPVVVIASIQALLKWSESPAMTSAFAFVLFASLLPYVHYLAFPVFIVYVAYALTRRHESGYPTLKRMTLAALGIGIAQLPLVPALTRLFGERGMHYYMARRITLNDLGTLIAPPNVVLGIAAGMVAAVFMTGGVHLRPYSLPRSVRVLLVGWATIPAAALFAVSWCASSPIYFPRYAISAVPGLALLIASGIRSLEPAGVRPILGGAVLAVSLAAYGSVRHLEIRHYPAESWRRMQDAVRQYAVPETPVLMQSPFPESKWLNWRSPDAPRTQMFSPLAAYPIPGTVIALPMPMDGEAQEFLEMLVCRQLVHSPRFILVTHQSGYRDWLDGRLYRIFRSKPLSGAVDPLVVVYERPLPTVR